MSSTAEFPIINIEDLIRGSPEKHQVAKEIGAACRDYGFFYIKGHGVSETLQGEVERLSRAFFALPMEIKLKIRLELSGSARRGFVPVQSISTYGKPNLNEGIFFGNHLPDTHPSVLAGIPIHGPNLYPDDEIPEYRKVITDYMAALVPLGHKLMEGIALSLNLDGKYFHDRYMKDPMLNTNVLNYPKQVGDADAFGLAEHTDYGFLAILQQDTLGGLEFKSKSGSYWIQSTPIPGTLVCNVGDLMVDMTRGLFRSAPHRVRCPQLADRVSIVSFFGSNYDTELSEIEGLEDSEAYEGVPKLCGTFGEYINNQIKLFARERNLP